MKLVRRDFEALLLFHKSRHKGQSEVFFPLVPGEQRWAELNSPAESSFTERTGAEKDVINFHEFASESEAKNRPKMVSESSLTTHTKILLSLLKCFNVFGQDRYGDLNMDLECDGGDVAVSTNFISLERFMAIISH